MYDYYMRENDIGSSKFLYDLKSYLCGVNIEISSSRWYQGRYAILITDVAGNTYDYSFSYPHTHVDIFNNSNNIDMFANNLSNVLHKFLCSTLKFEINLNVKKQYTPVVKYLDNFVDDHTNTSVSPIFKVDIYEDTYTGSETYKIIISFGEISNEKYCMKITNNAMEFIQAYEKNYDAGFVGEIFYYLKAIKDFENAPDINNYKILIENKTSLEYNLQQMLLKDTFRDVIDNFKRKCCETITEEMNNIIN